MRTPRPIFLSRPEATRLAPEFRKSSFRFSSRFYRFLLAFLLIVAFQFGRYTVQASGSSNNRWQRPGQSRPVPPVRWGRNKKLARARSIDGVDYLEFQSKAPQDQQKQLSPEGDNSSDATTDRKLATASPSVGGPETGYYEADTAVDDLGADAPERNDQSVAHTSLRERDLVKVRGPEITHFLPSPTPSFFCLHAHTPERGPPAHRA